MCTFGRVTHKLRKVKGIYAQFVFERSSELEVTKFI